ncbi:hypothetical protein NLX83_39085 [Allokutzneria sp. A3M-2-11 16]|uniref:hypothetical protein n=1 Tax=Allokutzneria sp. A3M-2-11 16 TaxID=2962043 RepID=UPI0020B8E5BB|nr:hypothetical protein [Allokutzneria sp. A3M-2-11 16]MCP3805288.1 hypothetical protein [Allokutzneria sp. A3M-2-11 16]
MSSNALRTAAPHRPRTAPGGAALAAVSALTGIVTALMILTIGRRLVTSADYPALWDRAVHWLVIAAVYLALVPSLRTARPWARIVFPLCVLAAGTLLVLDVIGSAVPLFQVLHLLNIGFAVTSVVLLWLPSGTDRPQWTSTMDRVGDA